MISIEKLYKNYAKLNVLDGLDLQFDREGIIAILGPNGAGKTTLIKSILGMVIPQKGDIQIDGASIFGKWQYRNHLSYMPQIAMFPQNLRVQELIDMIKNLRGQETRDEELISKFGLEEALSKKLGTLSGGTKQKVNILLTFMFESPIIILDEPTTGLDPVALITLKKILQEEKEKGRTILITTHIMNLVEEIADQVVFLLDGKIYFNGSVAALKTRTGHINLEQAIAELLTTNHV